MAKAQTTSLRLTEEDLERVEKIKARTGIDKLANVLRNALEQYLKILESGDAEANIRKIVREELALRTSPSLRPSVTRLKRRKRPRSRVKGRRRKRRTSKAVTRSSTKQ
jgi:predicted DNA-binding protein